MMKSPGNSLTNSKLPDCPRCCSLPLALKKPKRNPRYFPMLLLALAIFLPAADA